MLVWFYGGGWVTGDLDTADLVAHILANAAGVVVVSVDCRRAPELTRCGRRHSGSDPAVIRTAVCAHCVTSWSGCSPDATADWLGAKAGDL
jgi:hypothetical protein